MRKPIVQFTVYKFEELQPACQRTAICRVMEDSEENQIHVTEEEITPEWCEENGFEFYWDGEIYHDATNEIDVQIQIIKLA